MTLDILSEIFVRPGDEAASNSVDTQRAQATVQEHDFRAAEMPKTPMPFPPFLGSGPGPGLFSPPIDSRHDSDWRNYAEQLGKHEAQRGYAWGLAVGREQADQVLRRAELERDRQAQRADFAMAHPPTIGGSLGQAITPWVPTLLTDPLIRLTLLLAVLGGITYLAWSLGQRLLPSDMRSK